MSLENFPQLSLGTAALVIFAVCAGFVLLRGISRMLVGTLILGVSAWLAFSVWQEAPARILEWTGKSPAWLTNSLPLLAFAVSWWLLRTIAKAIASPFGGGNGNDKPRSLAGAAVRLIFALVPTALISLIAAVVLHHTGSVAEVRAWSKQSPAARKSSVKPLGEQLKELIVATIPQEWLEKIDPAADPDRVSLAKLISEQSAPPRARIVDPQTGKAIPRAIVVRDPELQNLAREGNFSTLLRHPNLTKALADPKIQKILRDLRL